MAKKQARHKRNCHRFQTAAAIEYRVANGGDTIWDGNAGQAAAIIERLIANGCDTVRDGNTGQAGAIIERTRSNGGDAVGNGNAGQVAAIIERAISNTGNRFAVIGTGNYDLITGSCLASRYGITFAVTVEFKCQITFAGSLCLQG